MAKLLFYSTVLFFTIIDCSALLNIKPIKKNCYKSVNQTITSQKCIKNFSTQIKSVSDQGLAKVEFNAPLACADNAYSLTLEIVNQNISNKNECENLSLVNYLEHSIIYYTRINTSSESPCNETEIIPFSEVYTGCYRIQINAEGKLIFSKNQFIETKHKMEKINQIKFTSEGCRNDGNQSCFIDMSFNNTFKTNQIHLKFTLKTEYTVISKWKTECFLNKEVEEECDIIDNQNATVTCSSKFYDQPAIVCNIKNIQEGKIIRIELLDEPVRCYGGKNKVWGDDSLCQFQYNVADIINGSTLGRITTTASPPPFEDNIVLIVAVIGTILIIVCIIFIIYIRRKRVYGPLRAISYNEVRLEEQENEHFDIFLVYARDCDALMSTMEAFKLVLEKFTQRNVYDIYDPSTEQELSNAPEDWVFSKLSRPGARLKTLLLSTRCADLQLRHPSIQYQQSRCHDDLFPLTVRVIADSRRCTNFNSLFVVNFSVDNQEYESFACFTPGRRFALPESLRALLEQLGCNELDDSDSVMKMFHERYSNLQTFFTDYPNYITDVLNV